MKASWLILIAGFVPAAPAADGAFVPENPPAMRRLADTNSPAHQAARQFQRGINLGNYLEASPAGWGIIVDDSEFSRMHQEGFDHVRVPVAWTHYVGPAPDFVVSNGIFQRVDRVVTNALAAKLAVILNVHHFSELDRDPAAQAEKFVALWRQIAGHYAQFPGMLAFELDNEPHEQATTERMNPLYARTIAEIRRSNPRRTLFVEPGQWGSIDELKRLVLPALDDNLIVSVHCYEPFHFTHQGASWAGPDQKVKGIGFPGPPARPLVPDPALALKPWVLKWIEQYNTLPAETNPSGPSVFANRLRLARAWSDHYGRPVHVGEFGCYTAAHPADRLRYLTVFRQAAERQRLGWAMWDWSAGFRYWDKQNSQPVPGIHTALFGASN